MHAWPLGPGCLLWRCPTCRLVERDLALAPARSRSTEYGGDPAGDRVRLELTLRRLRRRVSGADHGRVLEIGSGSGALAQRLAERASETVAVDLHPPTVAPASPSVRSIVGRLEDVPLDVGRFDLVVGIHVLEHVKDLMGTLRRVRSLLNPSGVAYFVTPNADCAALPRFGSDWWMLEDPTHVRFLSGPGVAVMAESAGFRGSSIRALVSDSLACDGATLARHLHSDIPSQGILDLRSARALAVAVAPAAVLLRTARPRWRPALEIVLT